MQNRQKVVAFMKTFGIVLIVLQIISLFGGMPSVPSGGYAFGYLLGYFLPGIIGVILVIRGNRKKKDKEEKK